MVGSVARANADGNPLFVRLVRIGIIRLETLYFRCLLDFLVPMKQRPNNPWIGWAIVAMAAAGALRVYAALPRVESLPSGEGTARWRVTFDEPHVTLSADGASCDVRVDGCEPLLSPGQPALPAYGFAFIVPAGAGLASFRVKMPDAPRELALGAPVRHTGTIAPLSADFGTVPETPADAALYALDTPWPAWDEIPLRIDFRDGVREGRAILYPVRYVPAMRRLLVPGTLEIEAVWRPAPEADTEAASRSPTAKGRFLPRTRDAASPALFSLEGLGTVDYAIVSSSNLLATTPAPDNFQALCAAREASGLASALISTEWIYLAYPGRDNPERIRNFVIDAHQNHGLRYLLLAGSAYSPTIVPIRKLYTSFTSGSTVYSAHIPSDLYYGCLDGDFDFDGDNIFGEIGDGAFGGDVDLVSEVLVGRLPVATTDEVANVVAKILRYEAASPEEVGSVAHAGEYIGFGGIAEYSSTSMEQIRLGGTYDGYATLGFADSPYADLIDHSHTLYDGPGIPAWTRIDGLRLFNDGPRLINHLGHGSATKCMKVAVTSTDRTTFPSLTNDVGFILYSQACEIARLDDRPNCWVEQLLTAPRAGVAAVANTRYGFGTQDSTDGPSHRFHRRFIDALLSDRAILLGEAFCQAREAVLHQVPGDSGSVMRWCYYSSNHFGDPAMPFAPSLRLAPPQISHAPLQNQSDALDSYTAACAVGPAGLVDTASPAFAWRIAGTGPGTALPMTRTGPNGFAATIPGQPLGTTVEYRITATTLAGMTHSSPADATSWHAFTVTSPVTLVVSSSPADLGASSPAHGTHAIATGATVDASAGDPVPVSDTVRRACRGYSGTGSVPASGETATVSFTMSGDSTLVWNWHVEHALTLSSAIPTNLCLTTWHATNRVASTPAAPESVTWLGTRYAFCGWTLDGVRAPAAPAASPLRLDGIDMATPRTAVADYLDASLDSDGNGLPDWWELRWVGLIGLDPDADPDGDGATNAKEYFDGTDPLDPASILYYPTLGITPGGDLSVRARFTPVPVPFVFTNSGNAVLHWAIHPAFAEGAEADLPEGLSTNASGQAWCVSTNRAASGSRSFHSALVSDAQASLASLDLPPLAPGSGACLSFRYFIHSELDGATGAWDGGIVEISADGGQSFVQLPGPYTHVLSGWELSPWPDGTPCLAGDGTEGWRDISFDLSAYAGQSVVLRFTNGGDSNTDLEGWYVDDIRVGPIAGSLPSWLLGDTSGSVPPDSAATHLLRFAGSAVPRGDSADICFDSNDPHNPVRFQNWTILPARTGTLFFLY
jgi:hypothetical protein